MREKLPNNHGNCGCNDIMYLCGWTKTGRGGNNENNSCIELDGIKVINCHFENNFKKLRILFQIIGFFFFLKKSNGINPQSV